MPVPVSSAPSWSVFDDLEALRRDEKKFTWDTFTAWEATARADIAAALARYDSTVESWDDRLQEVGGEPAREDWWRFRPLGLNHEENWSDWLAWLLQQSNAGGLARRLLGPELAPAGTDFARPSIEREFWTPDRMYRADIVIEWRRGGRTCIEVKIGDLHLGKTDATANGVGATHSALILPASDVPEWLRVARDDTRTITRTWHEVAISVRGALWHDAEFTPWQCWAAGFVGSVEQKLLGMPRITTAASAAKEPLSVAHARREHLRILTEGMKGE